LTSPLAGRAFWANVRAREMGAVAAILAVFDAFTWEEWGMSGPEALEEHGRLFAHLDPLRKELAEIHPDDAAVSQAHAQFMALWRASL